MKKAAPKKVVTTTTDTHDDIWSPVVAVIATIIMTLLLNVTFGLIAGTAYLFFAKTFTTRAQISYGVMIFIWYFLRSIFEPLEANPVENVSTSFFAALFAALLFVGVAYLARKMKRTS